MSVTLLTASEAGSFFSGSVVSSDEGSVLSSVTASTATPLSEGAVVSSPFFFDLQPQKRNIIAHMMSATAEISFLFIVFSFLLFLIFIFLSLGRLHGIIPLRQPQNEYIKICKTCQRKFTEKCQIEQTYGEDVKSVTKKYIKKYILLRNLC